MRKLIFLIAFTVAVSCQKEGSNVVPGRLQLVSIKVGSDELNLSNASKNTGLSFDQPVSITFNDVISQSSATGAITLTQGSTPVTITISFTNSDKTVVLTPSTPLTPGVLYTLTISSTIGSVNASVFPGFTTTFTTTRPPLQIINVKVNGVTRDFTFRVLDVALTPTFDITFSAAVNPLTVGNSTLSISAGASTPLTVSFSNENKTVTLTPTAPLQDFRKHLLAIGAIEGAQGEPFTATTLPFYTVLSETPKFPLLTDDELLTKVQEQTFKYFWEGAHPVSGMARERDSSGDIVTSGGSGFGIMAMVVAMERGFITRSQGLARLNTILTFLEGADRFHGAWSHWINGTTGKVVPFSTKDNGGDLVETSFLVQGLLTMRQYLNASDPTESALIARINTLWEGVEWDWYRKNNSNVLYWHWSPTYDWQMNFALSGYFEEQITYVLAAASTTHTIPASVYTNGFAQNGAIQTGFTYYGYTLPLGRPAPLFWVHYSYLGMDPHFSDAYANYWTQNVNASLINHAYCAANPKNFVGYSDANWGLTASDNPSGYNAHSPNNDLGTITPTAALSSFPYTPTESMKALKFFYYQMGDKIWGPYGFYDAFDTTQGWYANSYLAIDQGPIIVMIENYRTGLLWSLFESSPEIQAARTKLGFN